MGSDVERRLGLDAHLLERLVVRHLLDDANVTHANPVGVLDELLGIGEVAGPEADRRAANFAEGVDGSLDRLRAAVNPQVLEATTDLLARRLLCCGTVRPGRAVAGVDEKALGQCGIVRWMNT